MNNLRNEWYKRELSDSESETYHRPMEEEYSFYTAVKNGDMEFVRKNLNQGDFTNPEGMGVLSKNALTNLKYHFVVTAALLTRHCVEGGLELEQAYRLSDFYILKMDSCSTVKAIAPTSKPSQNCTGVWYLISPAKCLYFKKTPSSQNRLCSVQTISTAILTSALPSMSLPCTQRCRQATCRVSLNRISAFPSATISARKK